MKVALVHELLTMKGGAEKVLRVLADMFPDAPIYTLLYDEKKLGDWFPKDRVRSSKLEARSFTHNHHFYLNRFPRAIEAFNFNDFELVISSSSAFAHGIITNGKPKHLSYIHSPARYLWDQTHAVQTRAPWFARRYLSKTFHKLRIWDTEAAERADMLIAASKEVQRRIELYWDRKSEVMYPPIDDFYFSDALSPLGRGWPEGPGEGPGLKNYFLIVSTLVPYKQIDLAIHACNTLNAPLKIVGDGPDRRRLESIAGPTVEFLGFKEGEELKALYQGARALIFPGLEDFGLVPVESMACGTPVIAFRGGGALETVVEGKTGMFFDAQTPENLARALQSYDHKNYSIETIQLQADICRRSTFEQKMHTKIDQLMAS